MAGPNLVSEHGQGQGGRGIGGVAGSVAPVDFSSLLGESGLPANVVSELDRIFTRTPDINQAVAIGQAYVRSTPWYAQTFPGIQEGINKGLFSDESGYRQYVNELNQISQRYQNRPITTPEVTQYLTSGTKTADVANILQGNALAQVQAPELQQQAGAFGTGQLSQKELQAYGQQESGFSNALGLRVQQMLKQAQQRMQGVFNSPNLATPALTARELNAGVQALAGGRSPHPDVGAV